MNTLKKFQQGEISLTLSVLAIVVSVLGIALGSISVQQNLTRSSEANVTSFPYESTLELRDVNNNVIPFQEGMTWETTILGETTRGDIRTNNGSLAQLIWNGPAPERFRNNAASITVQLPSGYEISEHFCEDRAGTTCQNINVDGPSRRISNVVIAEGAKITYGWKIRQVGGTCEVSNCSVPKVRIDELSDHNVTVTWDYPTNCPGYQQGTDRFWVDVVRTGSPDRIVCATDSGDNEATCTLGRSAPAGRELDTNSEEYRKKEWDLNRRYFVNVHLYDQSGSCLSKPGGANFTYTVDPTAAPTQPQAGGSCSNTKCTYSQLENGQTKCYEGNCLDGSENCSLNTNCGWIEGCSTGKWITCPGHTPTLGPTRGPVQPTLVEPTIRPATACAQAGNQCVPSDNICQIDFNGHITGKQGCANVCCRPAAPTPTPQTQCASERGGCIESTKLCQIEGGRTDGSKGCTGTHPVCCKEIQRPTQCANERGACVQSGKICNLEGGGVDGTKGCTGNYPVCCKEIGSIQVPTARPTNPAPTLRPTTIPPTPTPKTSWPESELRAGQGHFKVVFVPSGYANSYEGYQKFKNDTSRAIEAFYACNVGDNEKNQLQFAQINDFTKNFKCNIVLDTEYTGKKSYISCDNDSEAQYMIQSISGDRYVILLTEPEIQEGNPNAAVGVGGIRLPVSKTDWAICHELGHSIAKLYDEYPYTDKDGNEKTTESVPDADRVNCAVSCDRWASPESCTKGCGYSNWYRPTKDSLMNYGSSFLRKSFNKESLTAWVAQLKNAQGITLNSFSNAEYHNSLHISLRQTTKYNLELSDIEILKSYPDTSTEYIVDGYITSEILDTDGNILYSTNTPIENEYPHYSADPVLEPVINLYLPYYLNASKVQIKNPEKDVLLSIELSDFSLDQPQTAITGDLCGNTVCDAQIGENENSCYQDCGSHLAKTEDERADLNGDGFVLANDLSILMDNYYTAGGDVNGDKNTNALDYQILIQYIGEPTMTTRVNELKQLNLQQSDEPQTEE